MTVQDEVVRGEEFNAADLREEDFGVEDDFDASLRRALEAEGEPLGEFEGTPIDAVEIKITGVSKLGTAYSGLKLGIGDRVRLAVEARVTAVDHHTDKDDNLVRQQTVKSFAVDIIPWNPADPADKGVIRS